MTRALLSFNEQLERIAEVGIVLVIGAMLSTAHLSMRALLLGLVLFLLIRPLAVRLMLWRADVTNLHKRVMAWFGIRGIGSLYYLLYAVSHGLPKNFAHEATGLVLTVISASIVLHGISATPLMRLYARLQPRRAPR
jgi:NhaP-type Na+/H+ or K+/H+ antiporter